MEPQETIRDRDIFENYSAEPKFYKSRPTVKGIVMDDEGMIALLSVRDHFLFPGGGVEQGESLDQALMRECKEEIGCDIMIIDYIGVFDQYRAQTAKKYEIHFFIACTIGEKGNPTTSNITELEAVTLWETKESVLALLEGQMDEDLPVEEYALHFNSRTHLKAFRLFLEMKGETL
jgi:ADP-ribose pyrophosphatase YjhB (NUDIX family)